jgi:hypothetical protein
MRDKLKGMLIVTGVLAVLAVGGAAIAGASGDDDAGENDRAITGAALGKAKAAALEHTGGGEVTGTEVDDEEGKYEVEVTTSDSSVDVHLDESFQVLGQDADKDGGRED